ncbi:hypothetical protein BLNAU_7788 [Blattamonas nauphoetae]|uniref:Uncharacterized protein n=1 Tax=Blattamonas nauphoetae TaxID=2049346 RepID=A0ABQ9Y0D8_9EUKA|nr:hypothetical protein BLNAU_7788 [Blattamonas nauphoetae]
MSENRPPLTKREKYALIKPHLGEIIQLKRRINRNQPEENQENEQFDQDNKQLQQIFDELWKDRVSENDVLNVIIEYQDGKLVPVEQKQRKQTNLDIIVAQSQTIYLIKPVFQQYSPGWKTRLSDHIRNFLLLKDGHILFSKSWLKNEKFILSAPLIFRPAYNIILHPVLQLIDRYFATDQCPTHPGGIFYITGDQGVGKTSLMLILMSSLSDHSLGFHYQKGIKDKKDSIQNFEPAIINNGEVIFFEYEPEEEGFNSYHIHIHDDSPPPKTIKDNHLYIIFTSPDQNRLPILNQDSSAPSGKKSSSHSGQTQPAPSSQKQLPRPALQPGQICFVFRLPTFSLAEDAAVMVGCTPTVPSSLLSPEDMELRKEELQQLFHIEREKAQRAVRLPFEIEDLPITSKKAPATMLLKSIVGDGTDSSKRWNTFMNDFVQHLVDWSKNSPFNVCMTTFLSDVFQLHVRPGRGEDPKSENKRPTWTSAVETLTDSIQTINKTPEGHPTTPNFSQLEDTQESVGTIIAWYLGSQTDIATFFTTLYRKIVEYRDLQTDQERVLAIIDWLIDQLKIYFERDEKQALYIKELIRSVVLSELNERDSESKRERRQILETKKKETLFRLVKSYIQLHPDVRTDIEKLSELSKSNASIAPQLDSLKKQFEEPGILEVLHRLIVQDEMERISQDNKMDDQAKRTCLSGTLIDMMIAPSYNSHKSALQSLFVLPAKEERTADTDLRDNLMRLHAESSGKTPEDGLSLIAESLVQYLLDSQTDTNPPSSDEISLDFSERKRARLVCDLLTMIVNPKHKSVETRLESVRKEIDAVQNRLSFVLLMDRFFFVARNMNILVTPHSILKGLSERAESIPDLDLNVERRQVFYRNLRDTGLSKWVAEATKTLLGKMKPDDTQSAMENVISSILANLKKVIDKFFDACKKGLNPIDNPKWLAIIRSMMNTILFLIDAGTSRTQIMKECENLGELLEAVYEAHKTHLESVADYSPHRVVLDDDENAADYMNDLTIFSTHFSTLDGRTPNTRFGGATQPDFDVESLKTLRLPRTLQIRSTSQNCLERMSIALFARNMLWFLKMEELLPFFNSGYVRQFFVEFLPNKNPGDVVHRSFVDFMNMTGLLSQQNFGLEWDKFDGRLNNKKAAKESGTYTRQQMMNSKSLLSQKHLETMSQSEIFQAPADIIAIDYPQKDEYQPFQKFLTKQFGVYLLLWASTELLSEAAEGAASQESETQKTMSSQKVGHTSLSSGPEKTVHCLNVARASIFGPSPRWLTSTDTRTNRGLSFLWDGVLKSKEPTALTQVADSNHSRIMGFNSDHILFEHILDAAWDDITTLVPAIPNYKKATERPTLVSSVFSLIFKKTQAAIDKMKDQISFVAISPFVEQIVQSEVISAIARLMTQENYTIFRKAQEATLINQLPIFVEEPLVCISFLLRFPTPIRFGMTITSFHNELLFLGEGQRFSDYAPLLNTTSTMVTFMSMLSFPKVTNRSVKDSPFPRTLSATKRGETDFYAEELQDLKGKRLEGLDALIVSRGSEATHETIFMPIQATSSKKHSLVPKGIDLFQQLLFQAMCHLEPSEGIVAMYNYATTLEDISFPPQIGILGFHMVSSLLKFEGNTLEHMPSILRHRDHLLVTTPDEPHSTMTTREITDTLLANVGHYPTFSTEFDPWTTTLSSVNALTDPCLTLPFRWKGLYDLFWKSSADGSSCEGNSPPITKDEEKAKDEKKVKNWQDRMVRRTMQELNRIGVSPDDLGEAETERVNAFSNFVLYTAISCRRNELLDPKTIHITSTDDANFVGLVKTLVRPLDSETLKCLLPSITHQESTSIDSFRDKRLRCLDKLCRQPCIDARLHIVTWIMSNHAMKLIRSPAQECLSVLQSEKDGGVFRVPTRNNLSAILHCGTVLLDNISPLPDIVTSPAEEPGQPQSDPPSVTLNQTASQLSNPLPHSPIVSEPPHRSKTLRIPLHSFVLAKYGFSDSIPALCELTQNQVKQEVTNVTPAPLSRWHPRRVMIDPMLLPQSDQPKSLSSFATFIHRLFNNPFIPVTTCPSPEFPALPLDHSFLTTQIPNIGVIQPNPTFVFVKSGSDFFNSPNTPCLDGVDTTTESRTFPIAFSTGYKGTDLREEMKDVFEPLTRLLPDNFPTGRPSLVHVDTEGNQKQRKTSSSKEGAEVDARRIVASAIEKMGATSTTHLFMFVVDEDMADHESLPMSLLSSDGCVLSGMMRQRSLADVLWILFLTRISREVMALPLITSIGPSDFTGLLIPFLANTLVQTPLLDLEKPSTESSETPISRQEQRFKYNDEVFTRDLPDFVPKILNILISYVTTSPLDEANMISSVGIELLMLAYPHITEPTQILLLSRLLMACPSHQIGRSRLDILVDHPSPKVGLVSLIRWFQLLNSYIDKDTVEKRPIKQTIEDHNFSSAKISSNLLRAFYQIFEHDGPDDHIIQLVKAIKPLLDYSLMMMLMPFITQLFAFLTCLKVGNKTYPAERWTRDDYYDGGFGLYYNLLKPVNPSKLNDCSVITNAVALRVSSLNPRYIGNGDYTFEITWLCNRTANVTELNFAEDIGVGIKT